MKPVVVFFDFEYYDGDLGPVEQILDLLESHRARACFNTCGIVAARERSLVLRIARTGHEVASHGNTHALFSEMSVPDQLAEIEAAEQAIVKATGSRPLGFRAPKLSLGMSTRRLLNVRGYRWTSNRDSRNWRTGSRLNFLWKSVLSRLPLLGKPPDIPLIGTQDWHFRDDLSRSLPVWKREFSVSGQFNLNLHPWLIGERLSVLDDMLAWLQGRARYITPAQCLGLVHERPQS